MDILLGTRPPFSGSRDLAEGMRFGLRQGQLERASILLPPPKGAQGIVQVFENPAFSCSSKTCSQADMKRVPQFWRESYCSQTPKVRLVVRGGGWPLDPWGWVGQHPMWPEVRVRVWGTYTPPRVGESTDRIELLVHPQAAPREDCRGPPRGYLVHPTDLLWVSGHIQHK